MTNSRLLPPGDGLTSHDYTQASPFTMSPGGDIGRFWFSSACSQVPAVFTKSNRFPLIVAHPLISMSPGGDIARDIGCYRSGW
jgi:hypothetical protein